jgi:hypothetical protein
VLRVVFGRMYLSIGCAIIGTILRAVDFAVGIYMVKKQTDRHLFSKTNIVFKSLLDLKIILTYLNTFILNLLF